MDLAAILVLLVRITNDEFDKVDVTNSVHWLEEAQYDFRWIQAVTATLNDTKET